MDTNTALTIQSWMLTIFHKEAIVVFVIFSIMFFFLASFLASWAWRNGQFRDMEAAKYEMMSL